jgi:hypothetical protein
MLLFFQSWGTRDTGIQADYVLMDTWFITEPMIHSLLTIGMWMSLEWNKKLQTGVQFHEIISITELKKL